MFIFNGPIHRYSFRIFRKALSRYLSSVENTNTDHCNISTHSDRRPGASNRIHVIESEKEWNAVVPVLNSSLEKFSAVGFDCEWPPNPLPNWAAADTEEKLAALEEEVTKRRQKRFSVSLIQLATPDGTAVLVRLNKMACIPDSLRKLLSDATCLKVGVDPTTDGHRLTKDYPTNFPVVSGTFDVRSLLQSCSSWKSSEYGIKTKKTAASLSLNDLCEVYLNITLEKRKRIICSDWAAPVLTAAQVQYAAADAQCSIDTFIAIIRSLGFEINKENWVKIYEQCRPWIDAIVRPVSNSATVRERRAAKFAKRSEQAGNNPEDVNNTTGKSER